MQIQKHFITSSSPFEVIFNQGSVVSFRHFKGAIVNAANTSCLGGGGVDGAISTAGGELLFQHRLALPIIPSDDDDGREEIRCPVGGAKLTGPGEYGSLQVPYVIHAVGPCYWDFRRSEYDQADEMLQSAYRQSLMRAKEVQVEAVAFSLISAGVYKGQRSLEQVLQIALETICNFEGYDELKQVHIFAFNEREMKVLQRVFEKVTS